MKKIFFLSVPFLLWISNLINAQYNNKQFSISININYTTTARIYTNPNSPEVELKNRYNSVDDIFSPSIDFRYSITEDILFGISTEYIVKTDQQYLTVLGPGGTESISIEDGFSVVPVEISAYYLLPFSTEKFKFLINGGVAYYYGAHIRKFGDEEISNLNRQFAYGIQVGTSFNYLINNFFSACFDMKFRDPEFEITSKYNKNVVNYNGKIIRVYQEKFDSKINIDGVTFILGLVYHF